MRWKELKRARHALSSDQAARTKRSMAGGSGWEVSEAGVASAKPKATPPLSSAPQQANQLSLPLESETTDGRLGNRTGSVSSPGQEATKTRSDLFVRNRKLRNYLRRSLAGTREAGCGRPLHGGRAVKIRKNDEHAFYHGLRSCGLVWTCPCCSPKIRAYRGTEIEVFGTAALRAGYGLTMLTLTARHHWGKDLKDTWDVVAVGFRKLLGGRARDELRREFGWIGTIRALEVTLGEEHGWHPHLHIMIVTKTPLTDEQVWELHNWVAERWNRWCVKQGFGTIDWDHGIDVTKITTSSGVGMYVVKAGLEITRADLKDGKHGSRTPTLLLEQASEGDTEAWHYWLKYREVSRGRKLLFWSPELVKLREELMAGIPELSDEEIAALEKPGEDVINLSVMLYDRIDSEPELSLKVLDMAFAQGEMGVVVTLRLWGLEVYWEPIWLHWALQTTAITG